MLTLLPQQLANGLALGSIYAFLALGLTLVFGVLLIPNFAQGELFMLGAFITNSLVVAGLDFWIAVLLATIAVGAAGLLLDAVVFRPLDRAPALSLLIGALAASTILQQLAALGWGTGSRTTPAPFTGVLRTAAFSITWYQVMIMLALCLCAASVWLVLHRSRLGLAIRAMAQNRGAAALMGIELRRVRMATFLIGSLLGGLAGALLSAAIPVSTTMGVDPTLKAFVVLVLGGVGSLAGAMAGGIALGLIEVLVAGYISSEWQDIGTFVVLVVVLMIRPQGLLGTADVER